MSFATKAGIVLGAAAFSGMAVANTGNTSNDLQSRLEAAEAKIAEMSAQQNGDWITEERSEQIRGVVQDVLADADTRASLQGSGATSGYNNGFFIQSADGKWSVKINGLFQERLNYGGQSSSAGNIPGTGGAVNGKHNAYGFESTRAALNFSGELAGKAFYNARLDWSPYNTSNGTLNTQDVADAIAGGPVVLPPGTPATIATGQGTGGLSNSPLMWAYGGWHIDENWSAQVGRQKMDVMRGFIVNAEDQQAIERSSYNYYWATSQITNGIKINGVWDQFRMNAMLSNGATNAANGGNQTWEANAHGWGATGRMEWLLQGDWSQFDRIGSSKGETSGMLLGVGGGYLKNQDSDGQSNWLGSVDLSYEADGWNAYGSATYGRNEPAAALAGTTRNSYGFEAGAGMYMNDNNELYARWQWLSPGVGTGTVSSKLNIATIGWNYYIAGPNTKLSADFNWCFSDPSAVNALGAGGGGYTGWWNNVTGGPGQSSGSQMLLRTQLQVSF